MNKRCEGPHLKIALSLPWCPLLSSYLSLYLYEFPLQSQFSTLLLYPNPKCVRIRFLGNSLRCRQPRENCMWSFSLFKCFSNSDLDYLIVLLLIYGYKIKERTTFKIKIISCNIMSIAYFSLHLSISLLFFSKSPRLFACPH